MKTNEIVAAGTRIKVMAKNHRWRFKEGRVDSVTIVSWTNESVYRVTMPWKSVGKKDYRTVIYLLRGEFICL